MATRSFNRKQSLEKEVKEIYARITIGAAGAPTLVAANSQGVASISRTSAGLYVLTLQDTYNKLMHAAINITTPTAEDINAKLVSETVSTTKQVTFRCCSVFNTTGVAGPLATDPASGDVILVSLQLKNSTV